jgi:hypothetical protein
MALLCVVRQMLTPNWWQEHHFLVEHEGGSCVWLSASTHKKLNKRFITRNGTVCNQTIEYNLTTVSKLVTGLSIATGDHSDGPSRILSLSLAPAALTQRHSHWTHMSPCIPRAPPACQLTLFVFSFSRWGETESTWYVGHCWPIVPAPDDRWYGAVGGMRIGTGNQSTRRKRAPVPLCPPQIPHELGSNLGRCGGKSATNRLSYGTACV